MGNNCKISFIIPFYNVAKRQFSECLRSILAQGLDEYEILLVDDGSTHQELVNWCKRIAKDNAKIMYIRQCNSGAATARNTGLKKATGDWIVFVDADDKLAKGFLKNIREYLGSDDELLIFDYVVWDKRNSSRKTLTGGVDLTRDRKDILANIMFYPNKMDNFMFGSIWAKCFSRKFVKDNSIKFVDYLRKAQDRRFMVDVFWYAKKVSYLPISMYYYRANSESITHKLDWKMEKYYTDLRKSFKSFCAVNSIEPEVSKFLVYSIFLELLPLTVCHADADLGYFKRRLIYKKLYKLFGIRNESRIIHYKDVPSIKGKIKLMFIRRRLFWPVYSIFRARSKIEKQSIFKDEGGKKC